MELLEREVTEAAKGCKKSSRREMSLNDLEESAKALVYGKTKGYKRPKQSRKQCTYIYEAGKRVIAPSIHVSVLHKSVMG